MRARFHVLVLAVLVATPIVALAQAGGTIRGKITLQGKGSPLHDVAVHIVQLKRHAATDEAGAYTFSNVPPGRYTILAHLDRFPDLTESVQVVAGGTVEIDFEMGIAEIKEEVTVTATGREESTFDAFQAVSTLESTELASKSSPSLGEVLDGEPGVAKRSFGPGNARPVIRGFDGDRVLVLQDGLQSGSLSSQSGDHAETFNVLNLDKVEVLKGPATLLYGSNAIGGVVNAISGHGLTHQDAHEGVRGYFSGVGGSTNDLGGAGGGVEVGTQRFTFWANGGAQRTGDYTTPIGEILNSQARVANVSGGGGYFVERGFFSVNYSFEDSRYGVPFAGEFEGHEEGGEEEGPAQIELAARRHNLRFVGGFRDFDTPITGGRFQLNLTKYQHKELEGTEVGTVFDNDVLTYRGDFDHRPVGRFTGQFGFWGLTRDYRTVGAESLAPPVDQKAFAAFALEHVDLDRARLQFGARVEHNAYDVVDGTKPNRSFTGFSGAAGVHLPLWDGGAFVANYTHSHRAPALEELYNFGPHIGNLTFEIGNSSLVDETSNGVDLSLRHAGARARAEVNFFYYALTNFVFLAPTGEIEDGLRVADYLQGDARYVGAEANLSVDLHRYLSIEAGFDAVDAELTSTSTPLPRIPPLRGRVALEFARDGFRVGPEVVMVRDQDEVFPTETRTPGYTLFNLNASYTWAYDHLAHVITVNGFNLGDRLYRNHLSFIKDLAPEMGRGVRVSYSMRFF